VPDPILRPATEDDIDAIAELWDRGYRDGHTGHIPEGLLAARTLTSFRERVAARVTDPAGSSTTVADVGGVVAGFTMVVGDEVEQVFVDRAFRGTDVAARLLDHAERQVRAAGHAVPWLSVVVGNTRARRFYEKCGWVDEGDLPYEVTAGGIDFVSPCRRYAKRSR
jgi:GNAT superfamily N-acetyltransferase